MPARRQNIALAIALLVAACVAVATILLLGGCIHYVASPQDIASARLGETITLRVMGLDAGEEDRRQALLGADYCLFSGILWRADAGEVDGGIVCRMPPELRGKDGGK